jgi:hypothetical protein
VIDPVNQTVTLTLVNPIKSGETVKLDYTPGANRIRDVAATPNNAAALTNETVLNFTPAASKLATLNFSGAGVLQNADIAYADLSFDLTDTTTHRPHRHHTVRLSPEPGQHRPERHLCHHRLSSVSR